MFGKKGQAAMEFLMTYGWAILVVLAAIAALAYFGVLSPSNLLPERTIFKAPFGNTENAYIHKVGSNVRVDIPFINNFGSSVTLPLTASGTDDCESVTVAGQFTNGTALTASTSIPNGASFILNFTCVSSKVAGDKFKAGLTFDYSSSSGITRKHSGQVDGRVE